MEVSAHDDAFELTGSRGCESVGGEVTLSWTRSDIEQTIGFKGARFTRVNNLLSFLIGLVLTICFFAALIPFDGTMIAAMFTERGVTPYFICLLSFWSLTILALKSRKVALQRQALSLVVVPADHDFVLSSATVDDVLNRIQGTVDDPKHFVLFNRIVILLFGYLGQP